MSHNEGLGKKKKKKKNDHSPKIRERKKKEGVGGGGGGRRKHTHHRKKWRLTFALYAMHGQHKALGPGQQRVFGQRIALGATHLLTSLQLLLCKTCTLGEQQDLHIHTPTHIRKPKFTDYIRTHCSTNFQFDLFLLQLLLVSILLVIYMCMCVCVYINFFPKVRKFKWTHTGTATLCNLKFPTGKIKIFIKKLLW